MPAANALPWSASNTSNTSPTANKIEGSSLSLARVTRLHAGAYLCIASNGVLPSTSKRIVLDIQFVPVIGLPQTELGASIGQDVTLTCHIESNPQSTNYWIHLPDSSGNSSGGGGIGKQQQPEEEDLGEHEELINGDKYNIVTKQTHTHKTQLKLTIRNFQKRDYGLYKCLAKNQLGVQSDMVRLYEASFSEAIKNQQQQQQAASDERQVPSSMLAGTGATDPLQSNDIELSRTGANRQGSSPRTHTRSWSYRQSNDPSQSPSLSSSLSPSSSSSTTSINCYDRITRVLTLIVSMIISTIIIV